MSMELKEKELIKRLFLLSASLDFTKGLERLDPKISAMLEKASTRIESMDLIDKYDDKLVEGIEDELLLDLSKSFLESYDDYMREV